MALDLYNQEENEIIRCFGEEVKSGRIDPENYDLKSSKAKSRYLSYIDRVAAFKPHEYKTEDFKDIEQKDVINLSAYIIKEIFGNADIDDELIEFFQNMGESGSNEILNGVTLTVKTADSKLHYITEIASTTKTGSIVSIVHEFIHFHCNKMHLDVNRKRYYEEILSIYAEKVTLLILITLDIEPDIMRKIEETRLEGLVWHYKVHPQELDWAIKTYRQSKSSRASISDRNFAMSMEKDIPWIKSPLTIKNALQYKQTLADSYGIGYLYSESLLRRFMEDKTVTEAKVRQVLLGEEKLQDMLIYFGINAKSPEVYKAVDEKISILRLK